jgi:hypothetical protein
MIKFIFLIRELFPKNVHNTMLATMKIWIKTFETLKIHKRMYHYTHLVIDGQICIAFTQYDQVLPFQIYGGIMTMRWIAFCRYFTMLPTWQYNLQNTHFKISIFSPTPFARKLPSTLLCWQHILIHTSPTQGTKTSCSRTSIWEDVGGEVPSGDL